MPRRRTEGAAPRRDPRSPAARSVRLLRVDLDRAPAADPTADLAVAGAGRVWVEGVRSGQVVGVVEAVIDEGRLDPDALVPLLAATGEPPPDVDDADLPTVTVVVPTLVRDPQSLARTVASLDALDHPDFDVVVVDNRTSPTSPPPAFPDHPRVRVVVERAGGVSSARNAGLADASGKVVAFTDDDAVAERGWLRALASRFALEPELDAVGGLVLPSELETEAQLWFEEYYGGFSQSFRRSTVSTATAGRDDALFPFAPGRFGAGCNMAFRRAALVALGGFDTTLGTGTPARGGEDLAAFIAVLRGGGSMGFEPAAVVRHSHRRTTAAFLHQVRTYGTGLTAMYTCLIVRDPGTLLELVRRVPAGLRLLARPREGRSPSVASSYPRRATAYQLAGMAIGPVAYARSWRRDRRARAARR
jgi:hypothetical protein